MRGVERGRSGCARAELCASAERQEDGCTGESMLPPNTDDGNGVGPHGPSRRSGRSRCMSSSIGRPVQNCAAYPQLAQQNTECSTAYPQLAKQTLALCASGVQPEMRPSVCGCKEPTAKRYSTLVFAVGAVRRGRGSAEGVGARSDKGPHSTEDGNP